MIKSWHFHCRGPGSIPGRGTKDPTCRVAWPKNKIKMNNNMEIKAAFH